MFIMNKTKKNFNAKVYLDLYPDVKKKYTIDTAWHHYNEYGKQENRIFTNKSLIKLFDGITYCNMYPDVKENYNINNAWMHYLVYGINESRQGYIKGQKRIHYMNYIVKKVIEQQQNISYSNNKENKITILIRTCFRPFLFKQCINSILLQNYSNINIIISYDNKDAIEYISPYLNQNVKAFFLNIDNPNKYKFNLYCNTLINQVESGYCIYLDDDNEFTHKNCLNIINHHIVDNKICLWKYLRGDKIVYPSCLNDIKLGEIDSSSFCIPYSYRKHGKWSDKQCGDYYFFNSIINSLTSNNHSNSSDKITFIPLILTKCIQNKVGNFGNPVIKTV